MGRRETNRLGSLVIAIGIPIAFVVMLVDRAWLAAAIVGLIGLVLGLFQLSTWKLMRRLDERYGTEDELGEESEAMRAIDAIDDALRDVFDVPFTNEARLNRGTVNHLLERLRAALPQGPPRLAELFAELEEVVRAAKPYLFTQQIRFDRSEVNDILDRMRASFAEAQ